MEIIYKGDAGVLSEIETNTRALRIVKYPISDSGDINQYSVTADALNLGLTSGFAAAGHIFHFVNNTSDLYVVTKFEATWETLTGRGTGAQQIGLDLLIGRNVVLDINGTAITPSPLKATMPAISNDKIIVANDTPLTDNGSIEYDTQIIGAATVWELNDNTAVNKRKFLLDFNADGPQSHPIILAQNEGLLLRNLIALASSLTANVYVRMDFLVTSTWPATIP